jgi:hypothetical protein
MIPFVDNLGLLEMPGRQFVIQNLEIGGRPWGLSSFNLDHSFVFEFFLHHLLLGFHLSLLFFEFLLHFVDQLSREETTGNSLDFQGGHFPDNELVRRQHVILGFEGGIRIVGTATDSGQTFRKC